MEGPVTAREVRDIQQASRGFRLAQVFDGDSPRLATPIVASLDENRMDNTLTFRMIYGEHVSDGWCMDITVAVVNGFPRIERLTTTDMGRENV